MAGAKINPGERTETARAIRASLNEAASAINGFHAQVLGQVIKAQNWKVHRDLDGFSALRDWLVSKFDFHNRLAADLAAIARTARKYRVLTESATSGAARVDQVAYAVRQLDKTPAMRLYARTPYREPVTSPFDPATTCLTPEHLVAQYCAHAPFGDLRRHLAEIEAACASEDELFEGLSEQALARLEVWETETGMWAVDGLVSSDTGRLFAKLLTTAVPPPRQEDCETGPAGTDSDAETEAALPAQANRNAEALHQMLAAFGADPKAPTRHGHTATLNLVCDIETLRGQDTGRTPPSKATRSASPRPACWPAKPASSPRCSTTPPAKRSSWAAKSACRTPRSAASWNSSNPKAAPGTAAADRSTGPKRTTWCIDPRQQIYGPISAANAVH